MTKQYQEKKGLRKRFNDGVRRWGNNRTKRIEAMTGRGLGDLLVADINFKRVGATLGALAPVALCGAMADKVVVEYNDPVLFSRALFYAVTVPIIYLAASYITIPASIVAGTIGSEAGKVVDNLLGRT